MRRLLSALGLACALVIVTGQLALATPNWPLRQAVATNDFRYDVCAFTDNSGDPEGMGCWKADGDRWFIIDRASNGASVAVQWSLSTGRRGICFDSLGAGQDSVCDYKYKESAKVRFRVGQCDESETGCNRIRDYFDWGPWKNSRGETVRGPFPPKG